MSPRAFLLTMLSACLFTTATCTAEQSSASNVQLSPSTWFRITVVDRETSRGIPCVLLKMTNRTQYWTDSAGVIAFNEPDLMDQLVWFTVESHGYVNENAPMGFNGVVVEIKPGGSATIPMRRVNIAQRLYRMTGAGIYHDSVLLGDEVPPVEEAGKVPVSGQDGSDVTLFKGKLYWLWGDTNIIRFPLGVYQGTCAVSDLPGRGGLDPEEGVALRYFRKPDGEFRPIINLPLKPGNPYWYTKPRVTRDGAGVEHFVTDYAKIGEKMTIAERGLVEFNEESGRFDLVKKYPDHPIFHTEASGSTVFVHRTGGREYFYDPCPYPAVRYPTDFTSQADMGTREAFTCLKEGSTFSGDAEQLDRDENGELLWGWKRNTSPILEAQMDKLIKSGAMKNDERWYDVRDVDTGKRVLSHHGSIYWNPYRQRWVCIRLQNWGQTLVGEVWYLEGDTPQGPWVYTRKIATHAWKGHSCAFYTPAQIPYFDRDNGRTIYFKGSFSSEFGDEAGAPPRHAYNIMMYKLDLGDERLRLPVPVYCDSRSGGAYGTKAAFSSAKGDLDLVWFAQDLPSSGTIPVYQKMSPDGKGVELTLDRGSLFFPSFHAVPRDADLSGTTSFSQTVPVYEFVNSTSGHRIYSTSDTAPQGYQRTSEPLFRAWPNPIRFNPFGKERTSAAAAPNNPVAPETKEDIMSAIPVDRIEWSLKCVSPDSQPIEFGVSELTKYMKKITGEDLSAADTDARGAIVIGLRKDLPAADERLLPPAANGYDGYAVSVTQGTDPASAHIVIGADNQRAAIYAVYDLLERMGCRWFYPQKDASDPEVIPQGADARLKPSRWSVASPFSFRILAGLQHEETTTETMCRNFDWALKCRYNAVSYFHLDELRRRGLMTSAGGHCFDQFLKNESFKDHPEWFGMRDGKRVPQVFGGSQFCWSNAEARKAFVDNLEIYLREHQDIDTFGFCGGDGQPACTCPECSRLNPSDWEIQLINESLQRVKKLCPNTVFTVAGAYPPCSEPPLVTQPDPDLGCTWAHWGRHHGSSYADERYGHKENLDSWTRIFGGRIMTFQYYSDHFAEPWVAAPYTHAIMGDREYLRNCGALGFSNLVYPAGYWWNWGLNNYLAGVCFYDPGADASALLQDYAMKYFGEEAGPLMAKYYGEWAENLDLAYHVRGGAPDKDRAALAKQRKEYLEPAIAAAKSQPAFSYRLGKVEKLHALAERLMEIQGLKDEVERLRVAGDLSHAQAQLAKARATVDSTDAYINTLIESKQGLVDPQLQSVFFPRVRQSVEEESKALETGSQAKQSGKKETDITDMVPPANQ